MWRTIYITLFVIHFGGATPPTTEKPQHQKQSNSCGYQSCHPVKEGYINVHIVPHTHDDVGWLKTVDQYFYGSKTRIQNAGVQTILDSVVDALKKDENRRFIYVETAFFWKWWIKQHDTVKARVRRFVKNGQLEFIGGAWSMNDEATTHYQSIIDQFTWGLRKLNDSFGVCGRPKVGWQIDPFGHSRGMALIFSQLGFDGILLGRIDYQDKSFRLSTKSAEMVWRASPTLAPEADIFTGVMYNTYAPPKGFCFDIICADEPIIDDRKSPDYNVDRRLDEFFAYVKNMTDGYATNNVIVTMGEDFTYQNAEVWFRNLDKLIYYGNLRQQNGSKYNLIYSTPSCYVKSVYDDTQGKAKWLLKEDDFFPYASDPHAFWTGFYTSRPTIKRFEREGNNFLQVCKQLYALADLGPDDRVDLNALREAMGVMQHHDAVTGTEKEHVAHDYARILSQGLDECEIITKQALSKLASVNITNETIDPEPTVEEFTSCRLLNISQCEFTENQDSFVVTVYNPLSRYVSKFIRLPVRGLKYTVKDPKGILLVTQLVPIPEPVLTIPGRQSNAVAELVFEAENIPPLGFKSYFVEVTQTQPDISQEELSKYNQTGAEIQIDSTTGLISQVIVNNKALNVSQDFFYYSGFVGDNSKVTNRSSGAYIFRPTGPAVKVAEKAEIKVYQGLLVSEVHQKFNEWVSQVIRIYAKEKYVEFDWLIGPIPIEGHNGKEIITRYKTSLNSDSVFYTDSNGRELIKRVRNFRPTWKLSLEEPIAGNYYPVTSRILLRSGNDELAVLTDRAQGGSSLRNGEIELMLHRECLHDDAFGVGEALIEEAYNRGLVARGSHYLVFGSRNNDNPDGRSVAAQERILAQNKLLSSWTFFSPTQKLSFEDYKSKYKMEYAGLRKALPDNVQILTLEPWKGFSFLLRLEHIFEKDEDSTLSKPVSVDLTGLFSPFEITSIKETTLGANQWLFENEKLKFDVAASLEALVNIDNKIDDSENRAKWNNDDRNMRDNVKREVLVEIPEDDFTVYLNPMLIRTFVIEVKKNSLNIACPSIDPSKLNVHLIPHSHDDLGWLQTVDKYFYKEVQYVISSVVEALERNPSRRFIQVETAYFHYWWQFQDDNMKDTVKKLINEGRLEITNGGWSMNDEATTHYQSIIDQFTFGHRWLYETFGECGVTQTGWQIDPFGHSREQASIYTQMGFDSFFIMRFDYRDKGKRKNEKTLDLLWKGSDNLDTDTNIFTSGFSEDTYAWPNNLCFDMSCDNHLVMDERSTEFNLERIINEFTDVIKERSRHYPTNNLFVTMGDDVHFQGAHKGFISIDRIIRGFQKYNPTLDDGRELNVFYSTPSCYAKAVNEYVLRENITLSYKTDDFLPLVTTDYSGCWTGFFTSRPTSKRFERVSNNVLQATKQLSALAGFSRDETYGLEDALGIMQHHDAITGTQLQDVEKDYHRRLHAGIMDSVRVMSRALTSLLNLEGGVDLHYCPFANITICAETKTDSFQVLLYNPLGQRLDHYVQIPVDGSGWRVTDPEGSHVKNSIYSPIRNFQFAADNLGRPISNTIIMFKAENLPPLGYKIFTVTKSSKEDKKIAEAPPEVNGEMRAGYQNNYVVINSDTGLVERMAINGYEMKVTPHIMFYYSDWSSGAYMFKPNGSNRDPVNFADRVANQIKTSEVSVEIKQEMRDWGVITLRIYPDTNYIEIDWLAGPIDVGDGQGKDVIIRYITDLQTNSLFYTDSNSREMLERRRNYRPTFEFTSGEPQAGNYYPVTSRIVLKDEEKGVEFAVITDRPEGGSSLVDGQLELMVHRALLRDEFSEHLYEMEYGTGLIARGSHYITFGPSKMDGSRSQAFIQRDLGIKKHQTPLMLFPHGEIPSGPISFLREELPKNVRLLTLQKWSDDDNKYLLRLEHFLEKNDDEELSQEVTVDVEGLFTTFNIISLEERTLNGITPLEEVSRLQWLQIQTEDLGGISRKNRLKRDPTDLKITLGPMQIRTFIATIR